MKKFKSPALAADLTLLGVLMLSIASSWLGLHLLLLTVQALQPPISPSSNLSNTLFKVA